MTEAAHEDRCASTAAALFSAARDAGMLITGDGRVSEADAAALLGYGAETLAKKRAEAKGPPSYRLPCGGARVSYRVADLAGWVEEHRDEIF